MMHRTPITLPFALRPGGEEIPRRLHEDRLTEAGDVLLPSGDPFLDDDAVFKGITPGDDSTNHDKYLDESE
jgi:hypothetical protein